jgi:hypothetical protein
MHTDEESGLLDYKIGYCPCGCKEPLLVRRVELREIVDCFGLSDDFYGPPEKEACLPYQSMKKKLVESLGGTLERNN